MQEVQHNIVNELDRGIADLAFNLFAVAGGGGEPKNVIKSIQALADALSDYRSIEGCDPPLDQIIGQLRSLELNR